VAASRRKWHSPRPAKALANIRNTPELWEKITFTFLCLVVYRVGSHVTAPAST
jgi:preprotein translocase subunit SecY